MRIVINNCGDHDESQYGKDHACILEHSKRCTRVIPMDNSRIGAEPFQGFGEPGSTLGEVGAHQPLRPLIERDDESRYRCYRPIPLDYTFHTSPREQNCSILSLL